MAIFGTTKETKTKKAATSRVRSARVAKLPAGRANEVILAPWFSEKALIATERGVYSFAIPTLATKPQVAAAIKEIYKVSPTKIHIVNLPGQRVSMRSRQGKATRARRRKAYVYLKKGDTIQFA